MINQISLTTPTFAESLQRYIELILNYGINLQTDQPLLIKAPVEVSEFVTLLSERAYQRGSGLITTIYDDPQNLRQRLHFGRQQAIAASSPWLNEGIESAIGNGVAMLELLAPYPTLLSGMPAENIGAAHAAESEGLRKQQELLTQGVTNACRAPVVTKDWASQTFPDSSRAEEQLWAILFALMRVNTDTALAGWPGHLDELDAKSLSYASNKITSLQLSGPNTDLHVSIAPGSRWVGASKTTVSDIRYLPSLPAEELFCALNPAVADGTITIDQPLALMGERVTKLQLTFQDGCISKATAAENLHAFEKLLDLDAGLLHPGELGVVPKSLSNVSTAMPMVDRNQFCHIGLGASNPACLGEQESRSSSDATMRIDLNVSLTRVANEQTTLLEVTSEI